MSTPTRLPRSLLVAVLLARAAPAQEDRAKSPPDEGAAEALLDRMDQLRFGSQREARPATLRMHGSMKVEIPGRTSEKPLEADVLLEYDGPRSQERLDYGAQGLSLQGFDEKLVWMTHPVFGDEVFRGAEEATMRRLFAIVRGTPWRRLYDAAEKIGEERREEQLHAVLRLWKGDDFETWVLDPATLLPERIEMVMPSRDAPSHIKLEYSDWRRVSGVLYPFHERCSTDGAIGDTTYDEIAAGVEIPPCHFDVPEAIKKLADAAPKDAADAGSPTPPAMQVVEREEQPAASIRVTVRANEIQRRFAELLPEVMASLTEIGATTAGPPFARFHGEKDGEIDFEAGIPVAAPVAPKGRMKPSTLPGRRAAMTWYSGPYSGLTGARARLAEAVAAKGLTPRGGAWIFYWTDPAQLRDPAKRRSQLIQPVE